jgi:two-component system nitrate/nitrite response regulator NarL
MRIVLCEDHHLLAECLGDALRVHGHEVAVTSTPRDAVERVFEQPTDVCIMDLGFPDGEGDDELGAMDAIRMITDQGGRVIVLSGSAAPARREEALGQGAAAFLVKDEPISQLLCAVEHPERPPAPAPLASTTTHRPAHWDHASLAEFLTPRERTVLEGLVQGESTALLARRLGVRPATARTHVQNLLGKLCVHSRLEAVVLAVEHGVVEVEAS